MSMMQAGCCCSGACSCPSGTTLPSSVTVTVTVTGCQGTTAVLTAVAVLNASATCEVGVCLCQKYSFSAGTTTAGGCSPNVLCDMPYDSFDSCSTGSPGDILIGISNIGIGTNGVGFNSEPYTLCDLWSARIVFAVGGNPSYPAEQGAINACSPCSWWIHGAPCISSSQTVDTAYCKAAGTSPLGTYEDCAGMPHEVCGVNAPGCDGCYSPSVGIIVNDITIA